jgi:hypothetical protein
MNSSFAVAALLLMLGISYAQSTVADAAGNDQRVLSKRAADAHQSGRIDQEIEFRQQLSRKAWAEFAGNPQNNIYDRYNIVEFNDVPLGLLLEGSHRLSDAEAVFRHNQAELSAERIAGNDSKGANELLLAQVLASEGKVLEASRICSHWKNRVRHFAAGQDSDHWYGEPRAPLSDTPEVETAAWDLTCGSPDEGLKLLSEQIYAHPHMLASFTVLSRHFAAVGDFSKALKVERDGAAAVNSE